MAWVFANWWQVLIVVWFGGVLNDLSSSVFRARLRWDMQKLSLPARLGLWVGPFFWPLHLLYLLAIRKTKTGARIDIGPAGLTLQRGLEARRLLEDLTVEFPIESQRKHVLMLGEKKGELAVCLLERKTKPRRETHTRRK